MTLLWHFRYIIWNLVNSFSANGQGAGQFYDLISHAAFDCFSQPRLLGRHAPSALRPALKPGYQQQDGGAGKENRTGNEQRWIVGVRGVRQPAYKNIKQLVAHRNKNTIEKREVWLSKTFPKFIFLFFCLFLLWNIAYKQRLNFTCEWTETLLIFHSSNSQEGVRNRAPRGTRTVFDWLLSVFRMKF